MGIDHSNAMRRAVFLDRDGVVNEVQVRNGRPYPPGDLASLRIPPGTVDALRRLKEQDYLLIVVTNQPDVARGKTSRNEVEEINEYLRGQLPLDDILTCYHDDADNCDCRKPKPGLLVEAAQRYGIDFRRSYMIGDRWRDIDAGATVGCRTILIDLGYQEREPRSAPDYRARSLPDAVDWILINDAESV
jgi:D-glycero-D-manno-heptose 1,7-bisphosphate phosphatase